MFNGTVCACPPPTPVRPRPPLFVVEGMVSVQVLVSGQPLWANALR